MARKRGFKKNGGSNNKKKQARRGDHVPEIPATDSAEQEQPLLQGRSDHSSTAHWTSPDTIPVEPAAHQYSHSKSTSRSKSNSSMKKKKKNTTDHHHRLQNTPATTFFSPPALDFASMKSPEARPIHTPYSSRRQQPLSSSYSDSENEYASSSASEASPDRSHASSHSNSSTPRYYSNRSGLRDQVRDLDHLLTSPLTVHLGHLADSDGTTPHHRTLGPVRDGGEDDDMSEEWDQLAQSEHLLREELASFDMGPLTSISRQENDHSNTSERRSIPPGIARQRLDPLASPIHPYNLFPQQKKNAKPTPETTRTAPLEEDRPAYSSSPIVNNKEEKKEDAPSNKPSASRKKQVTLFESPAQNAVMNDTARTPQQDVTNVTIYQSPRTRSSKSSSTLHHNSTRTTNDTMYHTAIYGGSSIRHEDSSSSSTNEQQHQLGDELDQLVHSMPLFDSSVDDFEAFNNLSTVSDHPENNTSRHSNNGIRAPDYVNPEISQLVHSVQEQLEASTTIPDTPPTTNKKKSKKRRTMVSITQSKTPDLSEGTIQVIEPEEEEETHLSESSNGKRHPYDEPSAQDDYGSDNDNEDDDMSTELNQLEESEFLMREALAKSSYDEYGLSSKPTPNSPPELTDNLIQHGNQNEMSLIQPVAVVPSPRTNTRKEKQKQPATVSRSAATATTATVTTIGGTSVYNRVPSTVQASNTAQAGVAGRTSSSNTPLSSMSYPSPVSNDTSGAVVLKVSDSSPTSPGTGPRRQVTQQHHPTTPDRNNNNNNKSEKPPPILTPEELEQMQEELNAKDSFPTPPSAVPSTRSHFVCGGYSTPPSSPRKQSDQTSTPVRKNSTPGSLSSRGSAVKTLLVAPCAALEHLVRTPSPDGTKGHGAAERPFQFVEGGDDSSDSSQSLVPFTPDELNELNSRQNIYAQLGFNAETVAKGTVSWEKEFEIEQSSRKEAGDIEMSEMLKNESQRSQPGYWMAYSYDRKRNTSGDARSETNEKSGKISDLLLHSSTRMKELKQQRREAELHHHDQKRGAIEMKQMKKQEKEQLSRHSSGHHSDSEVLSPAARRREIRRNKDPLSASLKELDPIPISPTTKRRSQSFSHRPPTSPMKKSEPSTPTSSKSADTWRIKSRADGGKSLSTLDAVLADLKGYRPRSPALPQISPSKTASDSPHRQVRTRQPTCIETPPRVYMNVRSKSHSSDEEDRHLLVDVENPDSNKENSENLPKPYSMRKRGMLCATICIVWLIVMGIVIALALLIVRGRDDSQRSTGLIGEAPPPISNTTIAPSISPTPADTALPSPSTAMPIALFPTPGVTSKPTESLPAPRPEPFTPPATPRPTASLRPVSNSTLSLISLLVSRSVDVGEALLDRSSPEYASLQWLAGNAILDSYSDQQKVQRFVLGTVYYSLNGDEWTLNSRWLSDWDECRWFSRARRFPVCNSDGEYVSLELGYIDATGTLPKALGMLSNSLERIDIQGGPRAFLTGTLPSELGLLTLMREFRVSNNELEGRVDLRRWNFLEALDLSGNRFTGALPFTSGQWPYATEIDLEENFFQGTLPTEIGLNEKLTELKIGDNLLSGPVPTQIGRLSDLEELMLEQNNFDSFPSEIGQLHKLSTLMLYTNRIATSIPSEIGVLTELRSFSAAFNGLQGSIPSEVGMLTEIRERFDVSYNALTSKIPSEIGNLKKMRHLLLHSNQLTGSVPQEVSALDRINTFRIDANDLSGGISTEICEVFNMTLPYFYADCSELDCPCCLFCCEDGEGCACRYSNTVEQYLCY